MTCRLNYSETIGVTVGQGWVKGQSRVGQGSVEGRFPNPNPNPNPTSHSPLTDPQEPDIQSLTWSVWSMVCLK